MIQSVVTGSHEASIPPESSLTSSTPAVCFEYSFSVIVGIPSSSQSAIATPFAIVDASASIAFPPAPASLLVGEENT